MLGNWSASSFSIDCPISREALLCHHSPAEEFLHLTASPLGTMLAVSPPGRNGHGLLLLAAIILLLVQSVAAKVKLDQVGENANPDVSGRVHFYAPRLDRTYPGSWDNTTPNPWTLELNITRDRTTGPLADSRVPLFTLQAIPPAPGLDGAVYWPNGSYTIGDVGPYAVNPTTQSWYVQMGVPYWTPDLEVPEGNDKQRGTCPGSIWTSRCMAAMRQAIQAQDHYDRFNVTGLAACESQPTLHFPVFGISPDDDFTAGTIDRNIAPDGFGTFTEYDRRGLATFPVALVFNIPYWSKLPQPPLPDENIIFACVKVDTTHNGAKMPTGGGVMTGGSARQVGGQGRSAIWFAIVSALFLLDKRPGA
ncbi:uncharacterized protein B0I36DRAFT_332368 [Microdochium trichocladiopsis]|uniref:Uncharacterized protein n=1 Tax=Microdochium trichocladiopsis TaxID=1682393 RepID=A0A9P8XYQ1_9PEZI|nr:uncharacterized protein B0I36DRAFT_332368 [Microdochium trichocladiopsis]KAH7024994.1 hypothetical protein B0I36DRAFT_332368 [Microdochium trichocladiopsis]